MPRKLIVLLLTGYAILFAFGAVAAVRWPSIMMVVIATIREGAPSTGFENVNWRELGLIYGGPYLIAALCFYASAVYVDDRRHGAFFWYALACGAGYPIAWMVDFEAGWWRNPSAAEGAVAGAALGSIFLGLAVWELRRRRPRSERPQKPKPARRPLFSPPPGHVSAAIMRQRACFAQQGAKMMVRRRRKLVW